MSSIHTIAIIFAVTPLVIVLVFAAAALWLRSSVWATVCEVIAHGSLALGFAAFFYYVIPRYKKLFEDLGTELPGMTKMLIAFSDTIVNYWYVMALPVLAGLVIDAVAFGAFHRVSESRYVARIFSALITLALLAQAAVVGYVLFMSQAQLLQSLP